MRIIIASLKIFAFALIVLLIIPTQSLWLLFSKGPNSYILPRLWHWATCKIFRVKVRVEGDYSHDHQKLFMSNHVSYIDIPVIGSVVKASFVAKSDVASWPVFGFLSHLQQTAFISRRRTAIAGEKKAIGKLVASGRELIIFPEGTSTDGQSVLDFKSSLFAIALDEGNDGLYVQPMTLRVDGSDGGGAPKTQEERNLYSWHVEMDTPLAEHLWRFAKHRGADITLIFHAPIKATDFDSRKTLAKACHARVISGLHNS